MHVAIVHACRDRAEFSEIIELEEVAQALGIPIPCTLPQFFTAFRAGISCILACAQHAYPPVILPDFRCNECTEYRSVHPDCRRRAASSESWDDRRLRKSFTSAYIGARCFGCSELSALNTSNRPEGSPTSIMADAVDESEDIEFMLILAGLRQYAPSVSPCGRGVM